MNDFPEGGVLCRFEVVKPPVGAQRLELLDALGRKAAALLFKHAHPFEHLGVFKGQQIQLCKNGRREGCSIIQIVHKQYDARIVGLRWMSAINKLHLLKHMAHWRE